MSCKQNWTKLCLTILLPLFFLLLLAKPGNAETTIGVILDGQPLHLSEQPVNRQEHVLVPMRPIFEAFQSKIYWDDSSKSVRAFSAQGVVTLHVGHDEATRNGEPVKLDVPPSLIDGHTYVPIRFVAESLGADVQWDNEQKQVVIDTTPAPASKPAQATETEADTDANAGAGASPDSETPPSETAAIKLTPKEMDLFMRVINAEAYGEPYQGKVAVGAVIVNRLRSPSFPNTMLKVLLAPHQFYVIENGQYKRPLASDVKKAALAALAGEDPTHGALFFYDPRLTTDKWMLSLHVTAEIGSQRFAK